MPGMQGRVADPNGAGTIWVSPLRDVAHFLPHMALSALDELAVECDERHGNKSVDAFAGRVQTLIRVAADSSYLPGVAIRKPYDAFKHAELFVDGGTVVYKEMLDVYSRILAKRLFEFYFVGAREAFHPGEGYSSLDALLRPVDRSAQVEMTKLRRRNTVATYVCATLSGLLLGFLAGFFL